MAYLPASTYFVFDEDDVVDWFSKRKTVPWNDLIIRDMVQGHPYVGVMSMTGHSIYIVPATIVPESVIHKKNIIPDIVTLTSPINISDSEWGWKACYGNKVLYMEK